MILAISIDSKRGVHKKLGIVDQTHLVLARAVKKTLTKSTGRLYSKLKFKNCLLKTP